MQITDEMVKKARAGFFAGLLHFAGRDQQIPLALAVSDLPFRAALEAALRDVPPP